MGILGKMTLIILKNLQNALYTEISKTHPIFKTEGEGVVGGKLINFYP